MATRKKTGARKNPTKMKEWELTIREVTVWKCRVPAGNANMAEKRLLESTPNRAFPYMSSVIEVEDICEVKH